jgi:hypothetical protein
MAGSINVQETMTKMRVLDDKFNKSCKQIRLLNIKIKEKQERYNRAYKFKQRSWRYTLRLQLATLEGMRNMFYEYAYQRADELEALQDMLVTAGYMDQGYSDDEGGEQGMNWQHAQ